MLEPILQPNPVLGPVLVAAALLSVAEVFEPLCDARRVTILAPAGDLGVKAIAEPQLLAEALAAMLASAIRHSPAGGVVRLRVERLGDRVRVEVEGRASARQLREPVGTVLEVGGATARPPTLEAARRAADAMGGKFSLLRERPTVHGLRLDLHVAG